MEYPFIFPMFPKPVRSRHFEISVRTHIPTPVPDAVLRRRNSRVQQSKRGDQLNQPE